jgi:mRNA interferase HigB
MQKTLPQMLRPAVRPRPNPALRPRHLSGHPKDFGRKSSTGHGRSICNPISCQIPQIFAANASPLRCIPRHQCKKPCRKCFALRCAPDIIRGIPKILAANHGQGTGEALAPPFSAKSPRFSPQTLRPYDAPPGINAKNLAANASPCGAPPASPCVAPPALFGASQRFWPQIMDRARAKPLHPHFPAVLTKSSLFEILEESLKFMEVLMRLIKQSNVLKDAQAYPKDIYTAVEVWCRIVKQAHWTSLDDIRKTYKRSVDQVSHYLVFNIKDYRLIVTFNFKAQIIWYKHLLTHKEYEKGDWKNE